MQNFPQKVIYTTKYHRSVDGYCFAAQVPYLTTFHQTSIVCIVIMYNCFNLFCVICHVSCNPVFCRKIGLFALFLKFTLIKSHNYNPVFNSTIHIFVLCFSAGTYCPTGSHQPLPCPAGQYCEDEENATPDGPCLAGFFCNGSASQRDPMPCSLGHYCPEGTAVEEPCPPGTFSGSYIFHFPI